MAYPTIRFRALRGKATLNRIDIIGATKEVEAYMDRYLQQVIDSVKDYPDEKANSHYVRRGMAGGLLGNWKISTIHAHTGIEKRIINEAYNPKTGRRYMAFVQGRFQTVMHEQTGWQRVDLAALAMRRRYRQDLQAIYTKHLTKGS